MLNSKQGLVSIEIDDEEFFLRFSMNALCNLEDDLGAPIQSIFEDIDINGFSLKVLGVLFYHGLKSGEHYVSSKNKSHIARSFTKEDILERMDPFKMDDYANLITKAFENSGGDDGGKKKKDPLAKTKKKK